MAKARQLMVPLNRISPMPRTSPGHRSQNLRQRSRQPAGRHPAIPLVAIAIVLAAAAAAASNASAQTCLRPKWTECVQFPNGGRHTGVSPQGTAVQMEIPAGPEICVGNEEEIGAVTYAQFWRNGVPWPDRDWEVNAETFCFYKN
jgi:hypothetical protein